MSPLTDKKWRDYRTLNQTWSYQPTLAGRVILEKTGKMHISENICDSRVCCLRSGIICILSIFAMQNKC